VVIALFACQHHTREMEQSVGTGKLDFISLYILDLVYIICNMCLRSSLAVAEIVVKIGRVIV